MSRKLISAFTAIAACSVIITGSALVWPNPARSTGSPMTEAGSDRAGIAETAAPRAYIPAFLTMIDFERLFTGDNALPRREYVPVFRAAIDFDRTFASVSAPQQTNTPPNRERLRAAGWKRILGS